jgi:HEAT repeat protein
MKPARRRTLWFLAALGVVGALVMALLPSRGPSYQGLTLEEWLVEFDKGFYDAAPSIFPRKPYPSDPVEAIRNMGQPAVDALLERMTYEDPAWKLRLIALARKQSLIKVRFKPADARRGGAFSALCELGSSASNAVPRLVGLLSNDDLGIFAERVLARIGRASVEPLRARLAHEDRKVRLQAVQILGWIGPEAAPAVPQLIHSLADTNRIMRGPVIRALGAIGAPRDEMEQRLTGLLHVPEDAPDAVCGLVSLGSNSIPVLTRALTNEHSAVRAASHDGLMVWQELRREEAGQTAPAGKVTRLLRRGHYDYLVRSMRFTSFAGREAFMSTLALIGNLNDPDPRVRELSAAMLAGFPTESDRIVPALEKCLADPDAGVRAAVRSSREQLLKPPPAEAVITLDGAKPAPSLIPR